MCQGQWEGGLKDEGALVSATLEAGMMPKGGVVLRDAAARAHVEDDSARDAAVVAPQRAEQRAAAAEAVLVLQLRISLHHAVPCEADGAWVGEDGHHVAPKQENYEDVEDEDVYVP